MMKFLRRAAPLILLVITMSGFFAKGQSRDTQGKGSLGVRPLLERSQLLVAQAPSCVSTACHSNLGKEKNVHPPLFGCPVCHQGPQGELPSPGKKAFTFTKEGAGLCQLCHPDKGKAKVIHPAIAKGGCTACHDPHQSPNASLLRANPVSKLCFTCHEDNKTKQKYVHPPVATGACNACHNPHGSDNESILRIAKAELCFLCHPAKRVELTKAKYAHGPVASGACTACHDPHNSPYPFRLKAEPGPALCFSCHTGFKINLAKLALQHGAINIDKSCLNCHSPHVSDLPHQILKEPIDLCLSCHNKEVTDLEGRKLTDMKKLLEGNKYWHGPVGQKNCPACHNPHGSKNFRLLVRSYPGAFYAAFDPSEYELCFACHDKTLALEPNTKDATNFRNADTNLHYRHVNKEKGRTCRACHDAHATNTPKYIRKDVPFGNWAMGINYQKTDSGGSCTPGCHQRQEYDRGVGQNSK